MREKKAEELKNKNENLPTCLTKERVLGPILTHFAYHFGQQGPHQSGGAETEGERRADQVAQQMVVRQNRVQHPQGRPGLPQRTLAEQRGRHFLHPDWRPAGQRFRGHPGILFPQQGLSFGGERFRHGYGYGHGHGHGLGRIWGTR